MLTDLDLDTAGAASLVEELRSTGVVQHRMPIGSRTARFAALPLHMLPPHLFDPTHLIRHQVS